MRVGSAPRRGAPEHRRQHYAPGSGSGWRAPVRWVCPASAVPTSGACRTSCPGISAWSLAYRAVLNFGLTPAVLTNPSAHREQDDDAENRLACSVPQDEVSFRALTAHWPCPVAAAWLRARARPAADLTGLRAISSGAR